MDRFISDGAVLLRSAFPRDLGNECWELLWEATDCDEHDRATWRRPVIRVGARADPPLVAAANTERLHRAFDQLAGADRWVPRNGIGTFPIRFPVNAAPGDDGWHIESTGADSTGEPIVDPRSTERVLLLLFLFSDVGSGDAPTRIRLGRHLHAARFLFKEPNPIGFIQVARDSETQQLPEVAAIGDAGDVWLCHPS